MKKIIGSNNQWILFGLVIILILFFFLSFMVGRYPIAPDIAFKILAGKILHIVPFWSQNTEIVMLKIRMPRIIAAVLVGAALSTSGAAYQGMFRNPLVSPGILGVAAGAGFGAALAMLFSAPVYIIQFSACISGLAAVLLTYGIAVWLGRHDNIVLTLILAGIMIGMLFTAFISLIKLAADPENTLPSITYWLMGSLNLVSSDSVYIMALPIISGILLLFLLRWNLNLLSFGDEEAKALGLNTMKLRCYVIIAATIITSAAVSLSGIISMVGLVVPHLARKIVGADYTYLLPASIILGSIFLLVVDGISRTLFPIEIPIGILTAIIGVPFFIYLLYKTRQN